MQRSSPSDVAVWIFSGVRVERDGGHPQRSGWSLHWQERYVHFAGALYVYRALSSGCSNDCAGVGIEINK